MRFAPSQEQRSADSLRSKWHFKDIQSTEVCQPENSDTLLGRQLSDSLTHAAGTPDCPVDRLRTEGV